MAQISEWHLSAYVANVTPNGLSKFSDVSYNFENITENFTTNSNYSLMEIDLNSKLEWDSYSKTTDGELDSIYKKQVSDFNKAKKFLELNNADFTMIQAYDDVVYPPENYDLIDLSYRNLQSHQPGTSEKTNNRNSYLIVNNIIPKPDAANTAMMRNNMFLMLEIGPASNDSTAGAATTEAASSAKKAIGSSTIFFFAIFYLSILLDFVF